MVINFKLLGNLKHKTINNMHVINFNIDSHYD